MPRISHCDPLSKFVVLSKSLSRGSRPASRVKPDCCSSSAQNERLSTFLRMAEVWKTAAPKGRASCLDLKQNSQSKNHYGESKKASMSGCRNERQAPVKAGRCKTEKGDKVQSVSLKTSLLMVHCSQRGLQTNQNRS